MYELVQKIKNLVPYQPITGEYDIRLDANESLFRFSAEDAVKAIKSADFSRYPDPYATQTINKFSSFYGIDPNLVTAGNGSDELIGVIIASFLEKGEKILCFTPDFAMYRFYAYLYENEVLALPKNQDIRIDIDQTISIIKENNIRCLIFSNPCNPTSLAENKDDVLRLVQETNCLVVLDEAYMDFYGEEHSLLKETTNYDNLIVLRTASKALGAAGIRLGFAVSNPLITKALKAAKSPYNVNTLTQLVGEYVYSDKEKALERIQIIKKLTQKLYNDLKALSFDAFETIFEPTTNFLFIKSPKSKEIYTYLLTKSIVVREMNGYLRITTGTEQENTQLLHALKQFSAG